MPRNTTETSVRICEAIYEAFAKSKYGEILANQVRYARYRPENVLHNHWLQLLGPDVSNLEHLLVSLEDAQKFVSHCNFSLNWQGNSNGFVSFDLDEQFLLFVTAVVHDFAEAIIGDISWDEKTQHDEHRELEHLLHIFSELTMSMEMDLIAKSEIVQVVDILRDKDSKLGQAFSVIEIIRYVKTAIQAWHVSNFPYIHSELHDKLKWLTSNVFGNQISRLLELREKYYAIEMFLRSEQVLISEAFNEMSKDTFFHYHDQVLQGLNEKKFLETKKLWQKAL